MQTVRAAVLAAAIAAPSLATAAGHHSGPRLVVRLYDAFGVGAQDMATARATAQSVLRSAGIELVWQDCGAIASSSASEAACDGPVDPRDVLVRTPVAGFQGPVDMLGFSFIDMRQPSGSLATVFADRVELMAGQTRSEMGKLLGRVIAHEIGHLLLGTNAHANRGLMRAHWSAVEIQRDEPVDWRMSPPDARRTRQALLVRSTRPVVPVGRIARATE